MEIEQFEIEGNTIDYFQYGKGKQTLVFFPGVGSDCRLWIKVVKELPDLYKIYSFSLPPYASKNADGRVYTLKTLHKLVAKYLQHFEIKNPILIGHSLGGLAALSYTVHHPNKVKKLILASTPIKPKKVKIPNSWSIALQIGRQRKSTEFLIDYLMHNPEVHRILTNLLYSFNTSREDIETGFEMLKNKGVYNLVSCYDDILSTDLKKQLSEVKPPAMFIYGTNDDVLQKIGIPDSVIEENKDIVISSIEALHYIPDEKPVELSKIINAFLKD